MADLPKERAEEAPPFTCCGLDMFGPFLIIERRTELKRYGTIFTCLASKAVHLDVCNSMETDSFIQALRRLIERRGNIRKIRSDNGSNFVGAEKELLKAFEEMHHKIKSFLQNNGSDWIVWHRNQASAYEKQRRATIACLVMKFRGYRLKKRHMPPTK